MPSVSEIAAVILCGGNSRRMGQDKALLRFGRQSLLERAITIVSPVASRVALACGKSERYRELGLPLLLDEDNEAGPLGGMRVALRGAERPWVLVLACDMPRVVPQMYEELLAKVVLDDLDVCLFEHSAGQEPLCAVLSQACLDSIDAALAAGERRATSFWNYPTADGRALRIGTIAADARTSNSLQNLNTPQALEEALKIVDAPSRHDASAGEEESAS
ncbi:MAG: molybdopterin-guanine dinucleotide biosynthesis protein A [Planctomycetota bacterium]|jgi:molybdopterin-guanine dinucleotide biosynthesis protein A